MTLTDVYGQNTQVTIGYTDGYYTMTVYEPDGSSFACNETIGRCNITLNGNCNNDACAGTTYHCPTTSDCAVCKVDCNTNNICKYATIYSYECDEVIVIATGSLVSVLEGIVIFIFIFCLLVWLQFTHTHTHTNKQA